MGEHVFIVNHVPHVAKPRGEIVRSPVYDFSKKPEPPTTGTLINNARTDDRIVRSPVYTFRK